MTNRLSAGPLGGVQYVRLDVDGFNESGAGAADLAVSQRNVDSLRSRAGMRMDYHVATENEMALAIELRAAWQHEFMDDNTLGASFLAPGFSPFAINSTRPPRDTALVGLGINVTIRSRLTLFLDYDLQIGSEHYLDHNLKGGLRLSY